MAAPETPYDVIVIGGGVTGAGVARDAAMRGLKTLLLERGEAGRATTASSSHLIHGGLRYLLYDRLTTHTTSWDSGHIVRIARPLLKRLPILWPVYRGHSHGLETVETLLEVYDGFQRMKGGLSHLRLSAEETASVAPGIKTEGLLGAIAFDEWWVDAEGLVDKNIESARRYGAEIRTRESVNGLIREGARVTGVNTSRGLVKAKVVINAAGPWVDRVASMADLSIPLRLQKGTHLVYERALTPVGFLLEAVDRGRYVFVIPSPQGTLVGPTDLPGPRDPDQVATDSTEVSYLLDSVRLYFKDWPKDFKKTVVGARPLLGQGGSEKLLSREFEVFDHSRRDKVEGILTIGGGKMSDYRMMADAVVSQACLKLSNTTACRTHQETLEGQPVADIPDFARPWRPLKQFLRRHPRLRELHALAYLGAAFARHLGRRALGDGSLANAGEFSVYYR